MIDLMSKHDIELPNPIPTKPVLLKKIYEKNVEKQYLIDSMGEKASSSVLRLSLRIEVHTQRKIPKFHLISWCGNFVERHGNCVFPQNFHTRKLVEISVFYAVI